MPEKFSLTNFRKWTLFLPFVFLIAFGTSTYASSAHREVRSLRDRLHTSLSSRLLTQPLSSWARPDGYIYAIDVAQLLIYAARRQDSNLYLRLFQFAKEHLILNSPDDPFTQGFVLWRYREGSLPDASGTTEALRLAQGLWMGGKAFSHPDDLALAKLVLKGYSQHGRYDGKFWMIHNYFNLQTRAFATNSFLVDYDPDLVSEIAKETNDIALKDIAQKSYQIIHQALAPSGLIYDLIQPEIVTLFPEALVIFSPNDVIQLDNSLLVAERCVKAKPEIARRILNFALSQPHPLHLYYLGRTGTPAFKTLGGLTTYAGLVRLAYHLNDDFALRYFLPHLMKYAESFLKNPPGLYLYGMGETLLALDKALEKIPENSFEFLKWKP